MLVYNINEDTDNLEDCQQSLESLGFRKVSVGVDSVVSLWSAHTCVLMVKTDRNKPSGISGVAFSTTDDVPLGYRCNSTGFCHITDANNFDIYTTYRSDMPTIISKYYRANVSVEKNYAWRKFAGLVFDHCDDNVMDTYLTDLKFSKVDETEHHHILVSSNNKFYLYFAKNGNGRPPAAIVTVSDIYDITAKLEANDISAAVLSLEDQNKKAVQEIEDPNLAYHRIAAWDLAVDGRKNRYVIDNFFPQALPNLDIMATSRFNYNSISEKNLCVFENVRG